MSCVVFLLFPALRALWRVYIELSHKRWFPIHILLIFCKMPVQMCWQIFQTWINYLIQGLSLQLKMVGWSTGVGGFISLQDGNPECWKLVGDCRRCYIILCWDFLRKEKGKYTVTLINRICCIRRRFLHDYSISCKWSFGQEYPRR